MLPIARYMFGLKPQKKLAVSLGALIYEKRFGLKNRSVSRYRAKGQNKS